MMKYLKKNYFLLLVFSSSILLSQSTPSIPAGLDKYGNGTLNRGGFSNIGTGVSSIVNYSNLSSGTKGNKYYTNSWSKGTLIINDSIYSAQSEIQYDLVKGEVLINSDNVNNTGFIINDKSLTGFQILKKGKLDYFHRINKNNFIYPIKRDFLFNPFPLNKEKYILIDLRKKLIEPKITKSHYSSTKNYSEYKEIKNYYILNKENKYVKIKLKKKSIIKNLGNEAKEIINKHKINVKRIKGLHKLLKLYHSYNI